MGAETDSRYHVHCGFVEKGLWIMIWAREALI